MESVEQQRVGVRCIVWLDGGRGFILRLPNQIFLHDGAKQKIGDHQTKRDTRQYADVPHRWRRGGMCAQTGTGKEYVAHHSRVQDKEHEPTGDVMQLKRQFHGRRLPSNENKMSDGGRERAWLQVECGSHRKLERGAASGSLHRLVRCLVCEGHRANATTNNVTATITVRAAPKTKSGAAK